MAFSPVRIRRLRRTTGLALVGPRGRLDPPSLSSLPPVEPDPAERRPSASSRGRARPSRGSLRRLAAPGGFALAIVADDLIEYR